MNSAPLSSMNCWRCCKMSITSAFKRHLDFWNSAEPRKPRCLVHDTAGTKCLMLWGKPRNETDELEKRSLQEDGLDL